jgi:hypothetical protein
MEAFGRFWNANAWLIGIVCLLLAIGAALMRLGLPAVVLGLVSGTAFMWIGRPIPIDQPEDDDV